jgi:protein TonB
MSTTAIAYSYFALPWESSRREDEHFRLIRKRLLMYFLLLAVVFPWLPLPELEREEPEMKPPVVARILLQQKLPASPSPAPPEPARTKKPVEKVSPPAKQKKVARAGQPKRKQVKPVKKNVESMGVAAFSSQLQSLRKNLDVARLQARNTNVATGAAERSTRSVLGRETVATTSGGVSSEVMSRNGKGTRLAGRSGVAVGSPLGGGGGAGGGDANGSAAGGGGSHRSSVAGGRDMESIRRVFEQHKGAIYAIYNRALRNDPEIRGKYVFHIVIEPGGEISSIELIESELDDGKLERKLLTRIRSIDFGPEDVLATPVNYKFDFLPG